jgi:hypothetical protein
MKEPEPDIRQGEESPFVRFAKTLRGLMGVSKRALDERLAEEKRGQKPQRRRGQKRG